MTNEEKKAIETIKDLKEIKWYEHAFDKGTEILSEEEKQDIDVILNLLEKKDNRINQLENMNEFQSKDIKKIVDYTFELNKEIEQQDKIIDLMSEQLTTPVHDKEYVKQYFENKAKE